MIDSERELFLNLLLSLQKNSQGFCERWRLYRTLILCLEFPPPKAKTSLGQKKKGSRNDQSKENEKINVFVETATKKMIAEVIY